MDRYKGYSDKDIEIDKKDVSNKLDQAIELKAKVDDERKQYIQKIINSTKTECEILKNHIDMANKQNVDINGLANVLKNDKRYQDMKKETDRLLNEEQIRFNQMQIKRAKEISDKAIKSKSKELDRGR